jgi:hypothetical protein
VAYDALAVTPLWGHRWDDAAGNNDNASGLAVDPDGSRVFVMGKSYRRGDSWDYVTVAYSTH